MTRPKPKPNVASSERRDPATGLAPNPYPKHDLSHQEMDAVHGTLEERRAADGYDVDAVLAASNEFRSKIGGGAFPWMVRGEALHIARALRAVK